MISYARVVWTLVDLRYTWNLPSEARDKGEGAPHYVPPADFPTRMRNRMKRETAETKISPPVFTYQTGVVKVVAFLQSMPLIARAREGGGTETTKNEKNATRYRRRHAPLTAIPPC